MSTAARLAVLAPLVLVPAVFTPIASAGRQGLCIDVGVEMTPSPDLQIVAWVEDTAGQYVDTIFITRKTGRYGMGNRPGRFDFNSGPPGKDNWPYGRRITTFPVWSHKNGKSFSQVVFQNGDENNLSHPFNQSSREASPPYCRPMLPTETGWDTATCASAVFTDKGQFSMTQTTGYPPRSDLVRQPSIDSPSVDMYKSLNVFDAVSQATPAGGAPFTIDWAAPQSLDVGNYVMWVEVSKEYDTNATYNATTFAPPGGIPWAEYGQPYRGQPSVVYSVPFTIGTAEAKTSTMTYVGYGDPDGKDGAIRAPDSTIETTTPGSGAARLQLVADGSDMYRVRVDMKPELDQIAPDAPTSFVAGGGSGTSEVLSFVEPGDDGSTGKVTGYEIRVSANAEMTADNFANGTPVTATVIPTAAGTTQTFQVDGLLPETDYWIGVRAYDNCFNQGTVAIAKFTTAVNQAGEVNACFIATAAYGSVMANDVEALRHFRDAMLKSTVLGELAVETYYTFGPPVAVVVGQSELLRASARDVLAPIVARVRTLTY